MWGVSFSHTSHAFVSGFLEREKAKVQRKAEDEIDRARWRERKKKAQERKS